MVEELPHGYTADVLLVAHQATQTLTDFFIEFESASAWMRAPALSTASEAQERQFVR